MNSVAEEEILRKNRRQVIIMAIALPLLAFFATYSLVYLAGRDTLLETTNQGEFVDPPLMARDLGLVDAFGSAVDGSDRWWVWVVARDCAAACRKALGALAELPDQMPRRTPPVQLALVVTGQETGMADGRSIAFERFRATAGNGLADGVYVVDPPGNLVLRYGLGTGVQSLIEDLTKMLRTSGRG